MPITTLLARWLAVYGMSRRDGWQLVGALVSGVTNVVYRVIEVRTTTYIASGIQELLNQPSSSAPTKGAMPPAMIALNWRAIATPM